MGQAVEGRQLRKWCWAVKSGGVKGYYGAPHHASQ